jgi:hydrogenase maturation protease
MLIIGIGNAYRGDDAVGLLIARRLSARLKHVTIQEATGEGAALIDMWQDAASVLLIDAVSSGVAPGTIHRIDAHTQPIPAVFFRYSTHTFGVGEAVEMARVLGQLPAQVVIYGIEGAAFEIGDELSPQIERAIPDVVERICREVAA